MKNVVVIGAGIGGLAVAARLAAAGLSVHIMEKEAHVGGRLSQESMDGFSFDIGPTILLFPEVLERLFSDIGEDIRHHVGLLRCDPNYRVHFADGSALTLPSERGHLKQAIDDFARGEGQGVLDYLAAADVKKRVAFDVFLREPFDHVKTMATPKIVRALVKSEAHRSVAAVVAKYIRDPRLRKALTFQTMYLGVSPFDAPALFGLLASTEFEEGIWYVKGGLSRISTALASLAQKKGATIRCRTSVRHIKKKNDRVVGVTTEDGAFHAADVVIANADLPYVYRELLERPLGRALSFTSSALVFLFATRHRHDELLHHNVFLGRDYRRSFEQIFRQHRVPDDPSFYVANPVTIDESVAPRGQSAIYALLPVPHLHPDGPDWNDARTIRTLRDHVLSSIEQKVVPGFREGILREKAITPLDWKSRFSLDHGAAFGIAHTIDQVAAFRPPQRDPHFENLYFVGASTQPATGIPNVLIGAEQVATRVLRQCRSTSYATWPMAPSSV